MSDKLFEQTRQDIADATLQVSTCFDFDIAAVTGKSGVISHRLLEATGLSTDRIRSIPRSLSDNLYRDAPFRLSDEQKNYLINRLKTVDIHIAPNLRLLIVDEYIGSSNKSRFYINTMRNLGLVNFKFASITHPADFDLELVGDPFLRDKLFIPRYANKRCQQDAHSAMVQLVYHYLDSVREVRGSPSFDDEAAESAKIAEEAITGLVTTIKKFSSD